MTLTGEQGEQSIGNKDQGVQDQEKKNRKQTQEMRGNKKKVGAAAGRPEVREEMRGKC